MAIRCEPSSLHPPTTTVKTMGGHSYAIPPQAIVSASKPSMTAKLVPIIALVCFPITISAVIIFTGLVVFGPKSFKDNFLAKTIPNAKKAPQTWTENQRKLLLDHISGRK